MITSYLTTKCCQTTKEEVSAQSKTHISTSSESSSRSQEANKSTQSETHYNSWPTKVNPSDASCIWWTSSAILLQLRSYPQKSGQRAAVGCRRRPAFNVLREEQEIQMCVSCTADRNPCDVFSPEGFACVRCMSVKREVTLYKQII